MTARIAVVGGGLIAQTAHLPALAALPTQFKIAALAEPSARVRDALAALYAIDVVAADWRDLLDDDGLDAVIVCSPAHTHAEIVLACLDRRLHVLVEKPLCIDPADSRRLCEHAHRAACVVQVGYMKRYADAFGSLIDGTSSERPPLVFVDTFTYDPGMAREPFVRWWDMTHPDDLPEGLLVAAREAEADQVWKAVGRRGARSVRAYCDTFLGALSHDVNLVMGVLDHLGGASTPMPLNAAYWENGRAASMVIGLDNGARWHGGWAMLPGMLEFRESLTLCFSDSVEHLRFPSPYFSGAEVVHERRLQRAGRHTIQRVVSSEDMYRRQLVHFAACIRGDEICRSPVEDGARDVALLCELFRLT